MRMDYSREKRTLILYFNGEIDHHSAQSYRENIDSAFITSRAANIIFDFSDLKFMDSSGIGLIMGRYKMVSPLGGQVFLTGVSPELDRLISISGIYKIAKWAQTAEQALARI